MNPRRPPRLFLIALTAAALVGIGVLVGLLVRSGVPERAEGRGNAQAPGAPTSESPAPTSCTIYWQNRGAAMRVRSAEAAADCLSFVEVFGRQGEFWSTHVSCDSFGTGKNCEHASRAEVCVAIQRDIIVTVLDSGGAQRGRLICANLSGKGWSVTPGGRVT